MPDIAYLTHSRGTKCAPTGSKSDARAGPSRKTWNVKASPVVTRSRNPIRSTLASITANAPRTSKPIINFGLGDPTLYDLHPSPPAAATAMNTAMSGGKNNGYVAGVGTLKARNAVAAYHRQYDGVDYHPDDIVLTHGVGQALDLIFAVLVPPSDLLPSNVLLPKPGFAQYAMLLGNLGAEVRYYDLIQEKGWEADLDMLRSLCDENTKAIVVTNPSNPCGSNFSSDHLEAILSVADYCKIPIIADEIYGHMTWNAPFVPLASISTTVPVITLSGLSKRFLLPGWRFGWTALHDPLGVAGDIKVGLAVWANRFFGPSSLSQAALPEILETPSEWHHEVSTKLKANAESVYEAVSKIPGLSCSVPSGALYVLVEIGQSLLLKVQDDVGFVTALYEEEAVFVLPGICFDAGGFFRIVIASPNELLEEMLERLAQFCHRLLL